MANWREIRRNIKRSASKAVSKAGDLSDNASLHIKLAQKESTLAQLYEQLGRVAYQKIKTGETETEKAKVLIEKIDIVRAEVYTIKSAFKEKETKKEADRATAEKIEQSVKASEDLAKEQEHTN